MQHSTGTIQHIRHRKFKPQFNETIKSLQFRKLYRLDGEGAGRMDGQIMDSSGRMQLQGGRQAA